jgi:hypothetical protein
VDSDQFTKKYHKAMVMAVKDDLEKVKAKVASDWVRDWAKDLGGTIADEEEFRAKFEEFLETELGFSESAEVTLEGDILTIDVKQCGICPGNEILRQEGQPTLCPILATGLQAISRVLGKKATLLGVDKENRPVGFCTISYRLTGK